MNLPLKIKNFTRVWTGCMAILFALLLSACNKALDARLPVAPRTNTRDTAGNVRSILASGPYSLFNKAFLRAGLDSSFAFYTVFAPTDSAMTAAGYTSAALDAMSIDTLYTFVGYHIVNGMVSDTTLQEDTLTSRLLTLRQDVSYVPSQYGGAPSPQTYPQYLYANKKGVLYLNGLPSDQGAPPLIASNGYIYPVNHVLSGPTQNLWASIRTRPELSMYTIAYLILDSVAYANYGAPFTNDTIGFTTVYYEPQNYTTYPLQLTTVLAPTNTAFANSGFNTVDDIRQYIINHPPFAGYVMVPGQPFESYVVTDDAIDSVLKEHFFCNPGQTNIFYQDMLYLPDINNGVWNTNPWWPGAYRANPAITPFYPQFSNNGGTVSIQWSRNPATPPLQLPLNPGSTFMATNGVIYETDQLFYPHN